jgi:hypothetical protein
MYKNGRGSVTLCRAQAIFPASPCDLYSNHSDVQPRVSSLTKQTAPQATITFKNSSLITIRT